MRRKARLWTGATLLLLLALNYAMVGMPLYKRRGYIQDRSKAIIVSNNSDDEYVLDIFRRETAALDKKIWIINCVSLSLAVIIASWTAFGLIIHHEDAKRGRRQ